MTQLIIVEGVPGSGKTTTSKRIYEAMKDRGCKVKHAEEGSLHPADLSWQSILSLDEYQQVLSNYSEFKAIIEANTVIEGKLAITAYTNLGLTKNSPLYTYLSSKEIYNIGADIETFKQAHTMRWKQFVKKVKQYECYVFECVLLQNHVTQLMLEFDASIDEMSEYLTSFVDILKPLYPQIIYLLPTSIKVATEHIAHIRRPEFQDRDDVWIDRVAEYVANTKYGKEHDLHGLEGFISFSEARKDIEGKLLGELSISSTTIRHDGSSWDEVLARALGSIQYHR